MEQKGMKSDGMKSSLDVATAGSSISRFCSVHCVATLMQLVRLAALVVSAQCAVLLKHQLQLLYEESPNAWVAATAAPHGVPPANQLRAELYCFERMAGKGSQAFACVAAVGGFMKRGAMDRCDVCAWIEGAVRAGCR